MEPYIAQVMLFAGNFAIRGWALCEGQILPISQHSALFSLLGTTYGGDGETTFGLPDLRGRVPIGPGTGPGLPAYQVGQRSGTSTTTLTQLNLPSHSHTILANSNKGNTNTPSGNYLAATEEVQGYNNTNADNALNSDAVGNTGNGQAFNNMQPYLAMYYEIALIGVFPSRN